MTGREPEGGEITLTDTHAFTPLDETHEEELDLQMLKIIPPLDLPTAKFLVNGQEVEFLVDSGATLSVLRMSEWDPKPKMSGRTIETVGAGGIAMKERFTTPLSVVDLETGKQSRKHSFLLSQCCPINLLARDLMCEFGIVVICTEEGLQVKRVQDIQFQGVHYNPLSPN